MPLLEGWFKPKVVRFAGQDYDKIRKELRGSGRLFEDPEFPAANSSLFRREAPDGMGGESIVWKRPSELAQDGKPRLFIGGASSLDVRQGSLGNCWFVAACGDLASRRSLLHHVIPDHEDQEWSDAEPDRYTGMFRFRFWEFGEWTDVVVDDRLPTINGRLVYVYSNEGSEFWSSLLEKAYAKLNGCYENLEGGSAADAMVDFSAGVSESVDLKSDEAAPGPARQSLYKALEKAHSRQALMSASITASSNAEMEQQLTTGLVMGHAYAVTQVLVVHNTPLVRLRNPWGQKEWNGPWSDNSPEWKNISDKDRKKAGLVNDDDGEFWMSFDDFCANFTKLVICRVVNTSFLTIHKTWRESVMRQTWRGQFAGGCSNYPTYLNNHQYIFTQHSDGPCMVALMQQDSRSERHLGRQNKTIGFQVMRVEENRMHRLQEPAKVVAKVTYINSREVFKRFEIPKGRYVIIPTTFEPGEETNFLLRLYTDAQTYCHRMKRSTPQKIVFHSLGCKTYPAVFVRIGVVSARTTSESQVAKDTLTPEWNSGHIFYCKDRSGEAVVTIMNHNLLRNSFMGEVKLNISEFGVPDKINETWQLTKTLMNKEGTEPTKGSVKVTIMVSTNLAH